MNDQQIYIEIPNDTTKSTQTKVNKHLMELKNKKLLTKQQYDNLYCSAAITPQFYGLIKLHKEGNSIRPIVAFTSSPTYSISQHLSKLLTPFSNLAEQKLKNTQEVKEYLRDLAIPESDVIVSFDVKALFTSVPTDEAIDYIDTVLSNNSAMLQSSTKLKKNDILDLLKLCTESTSFSFNGKYYKQVHGTPMGSSVSVVIAELFMQHIEERIFENPPC